MRSHVAWLWLGCVLLMYPAGASDLHVNGGQLILEGRLVASQLHIESGAWLRGNGALEGDLAARGHISPGGAAVDSVGTQRVEGAVSFEPGSRFYVYAATHTSLDRLEASGTVNGECEVVVNTAVLAVPVDELIILGGASSVYLPNFTPSDSWTWRLSETGTVDLALTDLRGDSDGNGLPDHFELRWFSVRTGTDPYDDADEDGYDNLSEYAANTLPRDSNSLLRITQIQSTNGGTEVMWETAEGRQYTLLYSTNVLDQPWVWNTSVVLSSYSRPRQAWTTEVDSVNRIIGVKVEEYRP